MSMVQIPNMPLNKFYKIKSMLHLNNNNEIKPRDYPSHDRFLFKYVL